MIDQSPDAPKNVIVPVNLIRMSGSEDAPRLRIVDQGYISGIKVGHEPHDYAGKCL